MSEMSKAAANILNDPAERLKPAEHSMRFKVVNMTPEWATHLLKNNHPNNRNMKPRRVETFERDMIAGHWKLTHQGIAIDEDGFLIDGQNRLQAVVNCGAIVPMLIVNNVPRKAMVAADYTACRSVADSARIYGKAFVTNENSWGPTARAMLVGMEKEGGRSATISHQEIIEFVQRHKEALTFAFEATGQNKRGLSSSQLRAVIARAWYKRNSRSRVRLFCDYLMTGLVDNIKTDAAVIKLRNWLMDIQARGQTGGSKMRQMIYAKVEEALSVFLKMEECERLGQAKAEMFPLESDEEE